MNASCRFFSSWPRLLAMLGAAVFGACLIYILKEWLEHRGLKPPENLGNTKAAALLAKKTEETTAPLKFAIVGDINSGTETFEAVIARLREEEKVDFLVLLGDCASDPEPSLHKFFIDEFAETGLDIPAFVVAGNHDVEPGRFEYADFTALYGPANFAFEHRGHLFIGLGGIHEPGKLAETLSFLRTTLEARRTAADKVFVFMHYTAAASPDIPTDAIGQAAEFQALFEQYRVSYVFSGHYHRLARTEVNNVVYLVTGGGGAKLRQDEFADIGLFHHLTLIKVRANSVAEQVIPIQPAGWFAKFLGKLERWGLTVLLRCPKLYPGSATSGN